MITVKNNPMISSDLLWGPFSDTSNIGCVTSPQVLLLKSSHTAKPNTCQRESKCL